MPPKIIIFVFIPTLIFSSLGFGMKLNNLNTIENVDSYFNWLKDRNKTRTNNRFTEEKVTQDMYKEKADFLDEESYATINGNPFLKERYVSPESISTGELDNPRLEFDFDHPEFDNEKRCTGDKLTTKYAIERMHWASKCGLLSRPNSSWSNIELFLKLYKREMLIEESFHSKSENRDQILYFSIVEVFNDDEGETNIRGRWKAPIDSKENCISPKYFHSVICKSKMD